MHLRTLDEAPTVHDYLTALQRDESDRVALVVRAGDVRLTTGGLLQAGDREYEVLDEGRKELAALARIPLPYFDAIDPELRAVNFNRRLPVSLGRDETLEIVSNGTTAEHIRRPCLDRVPASVAVEALLEHAPKDTVSTAIRAVEYHRSGRLDLALVARGLEVQPRPNDIVCGGVHLTIEETGAVQMGAESYRLACLNGAMARVCAGGQHRLRRGAGKDSGPKFMTALREFARSAWQDWDHVKQGLQDLAGRPLTRGNIPAYIHGLRGSPFFISAGASDRVRQILEEGGADLTLYDLHNAITRVGTHEHDVLPQYRYRLRLGAGQLARGRVGVCNECRRMTITRNGPSAN